MRRQILMCVETNKRANTDYVYITCVIDHFYESTREIIRKPIYLETKTKYRDRNKLSQINQYKREYHGGETEVIYFIDMDECAIKPEDKKLLEDIKAFCFENGYDLVLFNKDVEDVFWGQQVADKEKIQKAGQFRAKGKIADIRIDALSTIPNSRHQSNILTILDKYWTRKAI